MITTRVMRELGMAHPVFSAGMARVSQAGLAAAVSEAGGMGCLGGASFMPEALREEIHDLRQRTARPFAVNLLTPAIYYSGDPADDAGARVHQAWERLTPAQRQKLKGIEPLLTPGIAKEQIAVVLEERPAVLVLTFEVPHDVVAACHERGIKVMALCGSVGRAVAAQAAGADYIIAQGTEGGGHTGYVGTLALIPAVVDAVGIPVVAAGGISDGRGLAAVLCLGAEAAWCGTRFVASEEAYGHVLYKRRLIGAAARDTTVTKAYSGKTLRTLRNDWTVQWETASRGDSAEFPAQYGVAGERVETGYQDGDVEQGMMPAGQGVGLVHDILPAGEIVRRLSREAAEILARLAVQLEPRIES
ncbi:MAG TPA: nitronate monooxygenase [Aestuariivirgaceae bacterium]|nr:nitronate monooxygenase [Aestuariivirgaceae bacterium]